jgi:iron complex outermembrane receptor protein
LVGVDYLNDRVDYKSGQKGGPNAPYIDPTLAINIYNPTYSLNPTLFNFGAADSPIYNDVNTEHWFGVYFQDQITLWDKLHILGGGRQDWVNLSNINNDFSGFSTGKQSEGGFSPRVGVLYDIVPGLSTYGNWSQTFGANNGRDANGNMLAPEIGEQYEGGFKGLWFNGRLNGTLAFYHINKQNILTRDLNFPNSQVFRTIGEQRSRGIELDIAGQVTDNISLIGNYAYTDARITKDGFGDQGNHVQGVAEHSSRIWLKYEMPTNSDFKGLSFGGGPYISGKRAGDNGNTFDLPGFVRLDAFVSYRTQIGKSALTTQLNVKNLLDHTYYDSADTSYTSPNVAIAPGQPLTIMGSVKLEF